MAYDSKPACVQPEVLAGLAAAARANGQKLPAQRLEATPHTKPKAVDPAKEVKAATRILHDGATGKNAPVDTIVKNLPDRTRDRG